MALALVRSVTRSNFFDAVQSGTTGTLSGTPSSGNGLVLVVYAQDNPAGRVFTGPSGWTKLREYNDVESSMACFYKQAGGSESTSYTYTWTGDSFRCTNWLAEYSGQDTTTMIDVSAGAFTDHGFTSSDVAEPSITTATNGAVDIVFISAKDAGPGFAMVSPSGYTEQVDVIEMALYTKEIAAAGATGSRTMSHPEQNIMTYSFALRPSGGAAPFVAKRSTIINQAVNRAANW